MKLKELKELINVLPDDTDVVMQKRITNKWTMVAPVIGFRVIKSKDLLHDRLVLVNMKPIKNTTD
jgi:hypothetical protein